MCGGSKRGAISRDKEKTEIGRMFSQRASGLPSQARDAGCLMGCVKTEALRVD